MVVYKFDKLDDFIKKHEILKQDSKALNSLDLTLHLKKIEETPFNKSNHMISDLPFPQKINYISDTKNKRKAKLNEFLSKAKIVNQDTRLENLNNI